MTALLWRVDPPIELDPQFYPTPTPGTEESSMVLKVTQLASDRVGT